MEEAVAEKVPGPHATHRRWLLLLLLVYQPAPHGAHGLSTLRQPCPAGHGRHWLLPARGAVISGGAHSLHPLPPTAALIEPGRHGTHALCPDIKVIWPAGHGRHAPVPCAGAYLPAGQRSHRARAALGAEPAAHGTHSVCPTVSAMRPLPHGRHAPISFVGPYFPSAHASHTEPITALLGARPAAHGVHAVLPTEAAMVPDGHAGHTSVPSPGAYVPRGHASQIERAAFGAVPGPQIVGHAVAPVTFTILPAGHAAHSPVLHQAAYLPATHKSHLVGALSELGAYPAPHTWQFFVPVLSATVPD